VRRILTTLSVSLDNLLDMSFLSRLYFLSRVIEDDDLNLSWKTPVPSERLTMYVMVGKSAGKHCLRRDLGRGSRSHKSLEELRIIFDISSSVTGLKKVRLVGVFFGDVLGDSCLVADFRAACSKKFCQRRRWQTSEKEILLMRMTVDKTLVYNRGDC